MEDIFAWPDRPPLAAYVACVLLMSTALGTSLSYAVATPIGAGCRAVWLTLAGGILGGAAFTYAEPGLRPVLLVRVRA